MNRIDYPITTTKFILNSGLPECCKCKHFIPYNSKELNYTLGKCRIYGQKNIVSGEIEYEFADHCRQNIGQCTKHGFHYEAKDLHNIKAKN
jgi:hypothetical protein